jgi:zinc protease
MPLVKRTIFPFLLALLLIFPLAAEETSYAGLFRYKLDNGLEVFVYRDRGLPTARVELCFRAGAIAQSADNAGIFRLYERSVLGGKAMSEQKPAVRAALSALGVSEWKGGVESERVAYWLKLPSNKVEEGMRFWAERLRPDSFDPDALEADKAAEIAELKTAIAAPDTIYEAALDRRLFGRYPWRLDPNGKEGAIAAATPAALEKIRDSYFNPNNAALIVGGDVDPDSVFAAAKSAFAEWKAGPDPWKNPLPPQPKPGVTRPTWVVYPDASMPEGVALVEARYRGPDLEADPEASYAADLWTSLVSDPSGRFRSGIAKAVSKLYGDNPIAVYYLPQRGSGLLSISAYLSLGKGSSAVEKAQSFKERARGFEITSMRSDPSYFSTREYEEAKRQLVNARKLQLETTDGLVDALARAWASASADYFLGYEAAIENTGARDVIAFLDSYVLHNLEVVSLRVSLQDYEDERKSFANSGFDVITSSNAFWWQK